MKRLTIIFFIIISSNNCLISQNYPYLKFDRDTSLTNNKDCDCFDYNFGLNTKNKFDASTADWIYREINLAKFNGMSVGEVLDSISKSYIILDTTFVNDIFCAPDSLSRKINTYIKTFGLIVPLFVDSEKCIDIVIHLNDSIKIISLQNTYDSNKIISEIIKIDRFCMYSILYNFDETIEGLKKMSADGKILKPFLKESERIQKLKHKAEEISKSMNNRE